MDTLFQDLRHAFRMMRLAPAFTAAAVTALALGIGANTGIFSVVNTVLLRPLPYPDPERLVFFTNTAPQGSFPGASPTRFNIWRRQTDVFQDISAYRFSAANLTDGDPEQIQTAHVSADFFRLFGAPVAFGRTFFAAEDTPGGGHVAVLSDGFWKRRFGGDAAIVGRTISLNGERYDVIGVIGAFDTEAIQSQAGAPDVWLPFQIDPHSVMQGQFFLVSARLKPGMTLAAAETQMQQAAGEFRAAFPNALGPRNGFGVVAMQTFLVRNVRQSLLVLLGAVGFVLLIACANVANLLLVRATARRREMAIRAAIGAGRGQIVRQLLTESLVLSLIGGAIGLVLGLGGMRALLAVNPGNIPRIGLAGSQVGLDWRVLAFTVIVSLRHRIAVRSGAGGSASRADLNSAIKESGGRSGSGLRQNKARAVLVVVEMGLALVLLVGAALFIRTFVALRAVDPGFDARHVLTLRMSLRGERFATAAGVAQTMRERNRTPAGAAGRRGGERPHAACRSTEDSACRSSSKAGPSKDRRMAAAASRRFRPATSRRFGFRSCADARSANRTRPAHLRSRSSIRPWPGGSGRTAIPCPIGSRSAAAWVCEWSSTAGRLSGLPATCTTAHSIGIRVR